MQQEFKIKDEMDLKKLKKENRKVSEDNEIKNEMKEGDEIIIEEKEDEGLNLQGVQILEKGNI